MEIFQLDFNRLHLDKGEIYRHLGQGKYIPAPDVVQAVEDMIVEMAKVCRPQCGYEIFPVAEIGKTTIRIDDHEFNTGPVITRNFRGAQYIALFVSTAGVEFDEWLKKLKAKGDIFEEFMADAIGSEIPEAAARVAGSKIEEYFEEKGMGITNSFSPGYCGWHVMEQEKFFAMLPPEPCGIKLNDSCLMTPIKSVSGFIGAGPGVEKKEYSCQVCEKKDCYKNIEKR